MKFNLYYLNVSKVYEMAMLLDNVVVSQIQKENSNSVENEYSSKAEIKADYLKQITAGMSESNTQKNYMSNKIIETLEVKTTKSILLNKILSKCPLKNDINSVVEGDLVKLDNVKISLDNELELNQAKMVASGALRDFNVDGIQIGNLANSLMKDYCYLLTGKTSINQDIIFKIPLTFENEFENLYNIYDLLIGSVSLVGIYKGITKKSGLNSMFKFMIDLGNKQTNSNYIMSNNEDDQNKQEDPNDYHYIDILAIIQEVKLNGNKSNDKVKLWDRIKMAFSFIVKGGKK